MGGRPGDRLTRDRPGPPSWPTGAAQTEPTGIPPEPLGEREIVGVPPTPSGEQNYHGPSPRETRSERG